MRRYNALGRLLSAGAVLLSAACGVEPSQNGGLDVELPASAQQATLSAFAITVTDSEEGGGLSGANVSALDIPLLCASPAGGNGTVTLNIDFNNDAATDVTRTLAILAINTGGSCGTDAIVCDASTPLLSDPSCFDSITWTYADQGTFSVQATAIDQRDASSQTANDSVTVSNVLPSITNLARTGAATEGVNATFTATVEDPGYDGTTNPNEITQVVWTFTPAASVEDPTTITCDCSTGTCSDGSTETLCDNPAGESATRTSVRYLDGNATYTASLQVFDDVGSSTSSLNTTIFNSAPSTQSIVITGRGHTAGTTMPDASTVQIYEGHSYDLDLTMVEPGLDVVTVKWDYENPIDTGTATVVADLTGTVFVDKATYPAINETTTGILGPSHIWNDTGVTGAVKNMWIELTDEDNFSSQALRKAQVLDVDPVITALTATVDNTNVNGTINIIEGTAVAFALTVASGAVDDPSMDPLGDRLWTVTQTVSPSAACGNGGSYTDHPSDACFADLITVVGGCGVSDDTCTLRFRDGEVVPGQQAAGYNQYNVDVEVEDEDSSTFASDGNFDRDVVVSNRAPFVTSLVANPTTLNESQSTTITFSFTDPALALDGSYTVSVDWDDGNTTTEASRAGPGTYTATHTYAENSLCGNTRGASNTCTIELTVCEANNGPCDDRTTSVTVRNVAPTANLAPISPDPLVEGVAFALSGTFTDPAGFRDEDYDGTFSSDGTTFNGPHNDSALEYGDTHTANGMYSGPNNGTQMDRTITFTIVDADGQSGTAVRSVDVRDNIPTIRVVSSSFVANNDDEGSALAQVVLEVKAETDSDLLSQINVDWGDGDTLVVLNNGDASNNNDGFDAPDSTAVQVTITKETPYTDNNGTASWTANFTVTDEDSTYARSAILGGGVLAQATYSVENIAPDITASNPADGATVLVSEGQAANVIFTACDVSQEDIDASADFLFHVDWDDGTDTVTGATTTTVGGYAGCREGRAAHVYNSPGTYTVIIRAEDKDGGISASRSFTVEVSNLAPTVSDVFNTGPVNEMSPVTAVGLVDNRGADNLVYSFAFGCDATTVTHADFSTTTPPGAFTPGSPPAGYQETAVASHTYTDNTVSSVCFRVCDDDDLPNSCSFGSTTVTVNNVDPRISSFPAPAAVLETSGAVALTVTASDVSPTDPLSYSLDCGDGSALQNNSTGSFTCNYADSGVYTALVTVTDGDGGSAYSQTLTRVTNVAPGLTVTPSDTSVNEGDTVTLDLVGSDVAADASSLSYRIDWGDGVVETLASAGTTASTSHSYNHPASYFVSVEVSDKDGGRFTRTVVINVSNVAPVITSVTIPTVNEGARSVATVSANDPDGDALTYSFDFDNDGVFDASGSSATASWKFSEDGSHPVVVRVCDSDGDCDDTTATPTLAVVSNVAPVITGVNVPSSVTAGSVVVASASATDAGKDVLRYTFRYETSAGVAVATVGPQTDTVATVTITDPGAYRVIVEVRDTVAGATSTTPVVSSPVPFSVTDLNVLVSVVANPTVLDEGDNTTISVTPRGTGPFLVSYDVNGDGDFDDAEDVDGSSGPTLACDTAEPCSATVTYANNRPGELPYRVLVAVTDTGAGDSLATAIVSVTVRNVDPVLTAIGPQSMVENDTLSLTLNATDVGTLDELSFSYVSGPTGVTVDETTGALSWTPTYANAGANTLTVRVEDGDGGSAETSFTVTVGIIDTNDNGVSDNLEIALTGGLLPGNAGDVDSDGDGVSDLDEVLAGTNPDQSDAPTAPVIVSPDGKAVATTTPTLVVANAASPRDLELTYTFVVETTEGVEVGRVEDVAEGQSTTSAVFDAPALDEDTWYHWFAFANDGLADGALSAVGTFVVDAVNIAPPAPENLTPLDAASFPAGAYVSLEVRAVVDSDDDDVWYGFEVASADTFAESAIVASSALRAVPFYTVPVALDAGTYYWRAFATDGENQSAASAATTFTIADPVVVDVNLPPGAPGIVGPSDTTVTTTSVTLEISAATDPDGDTLSYHFELANNAAFAGAESSGSQSALTFDASGLAEDTTYFWRARASDGDAVSDWVSAVFHVNAQNGAPRGLVLLSPTEGLVLDTAPTAFVVGNAVDPEGDVLTYTFELATDEEFSDVVASKEANEGDSVTRWVPQEGELELTAGTTYFWRVTVSDGNSEVPEVGFFKLAEAPVEVPPDGCSCSASDAGAPKTSALFGLALLGTLGFCLRRRRR